MFIFDSFGLTHFFLIFALLMNSVSSFVGLRDDSRLMASKRHKPLSVVVLENITFPLWKSYFVFIFGHDDMIMRYLDLPWDCIPCYVDVN